MGFPYSIGSNGDDLPSADSCHGILFVFERFIESQSHSSSLQLLERIPLDRGPDWNGFRKGDGAGPIIVMNRDSQVETLLAGFVYRQRKFLRRVGMFPQIVTVEIQGFEFADRFHFTACRLGYLCFLAYRLPTVGHTESKLNRTSEEQNRQCIIQNLTAVELSNRSLRHIPFVTLVRSRLLAPGRSMPAIASM